MLWQDIVITLGGWIFIIALLPSIFSNDKPAVATSLLNTIVLIAFVVTYISLGLVVSGITMSITAFLWFILMIQKYISNKKEKNVKITTV
jgi:hypothetical protein